MDWTYLCSTSHRCSIVVRSGSLKVKDAAVILEIKKNSVSDALLSLGGNK